MGHRIPLHGSTRNDAVLRHRQSMVAMARTIDPDNAIVAGFRPQYMEHVLVGMGIADRSLLDKPLSTRQKQRRKSRAEFNRKYKELNGRGFFR